MNELMNSRLNFQNFAAYFRVSNLFYFRGTAESVLRCIERFFTKFAETDDFMQLDFNDVLKILSSSELNVTSEQEVFFAADKWMSHDSLQRSRFAEKIFLKIRSHLLSRQTLKRLLSTSLSFNDLERFYHNNHASQKNAKIYQKRSKMVHRYCSQQLFNVNCAATAGIKQIDTNNYGNIKHIASLPESNKYFKAVCLNCEIYLIYVSSRDRIVYQKYSPQTNTFSVPITGNFSDRRDSFSACAFMRKIYVIGGYNTNEYTDGYETNFCSEYDVTSHDWRRISNVNEARRNSACAVFQGDVYVSGVGPMTKKICSTLWRCTIMSWTAGAQCRE